MSTRRHRQDAQLSPLGILFAGGVAGMTEALVCHPLDTIKVRMQLFQKESAIGIRQPGFISTTTEIIRKEGSTAFYKGLGAVITGIIPKMAIRFTSFEAYKKLLKDKETQAISGQAIFLAGLAAGMTEAVAVVTPMEVIKIRLQAQSSGMLGTPATSEYRSATHALTTIIREEGPAALYRGISLTALRQGTNQAANFTAYTELKKALQVWQPEYQDSPLPSYQTTAIGFVSGGMGPLFNAPIDSIKTRLQKSAQLPSATALSGMATIATSMFRDDGFRAFYKGITPRIVRVAPGQAITFTVYEFMKDLIEQSHFPIVVVRREQEKS